MAKLIFDMPWLLCIALGFCLAAVSPAVLVPSVMILQKGNFGTKKGIPMCLIAASSFDDIIAITVFGVMVTLAFENVNAGKSDLSGITPEENPTIVETIARNFLEIGSGLAYGFLIGFAMIFFNYIKIDDKKKVWMKAGFMVMLAIISPILAHITEFPEAKYIGIIFFGYACNCAWMTNRQREQAQKLKDMSEEDKKSFVKTKEEKDLDEADEHYRKPEE
jgi:NhaP-type Na+/H+ or K+/H+ antiporter